MPSTTTNSTHLHSALSRIRSWRPLAKVTAVGAAAAMAGGVTLSMLAGGAASAATKPAWFMTAANVQSLSGMDSATAAHFFNTATAYGAGASLVKTPVQAGYATTPGLNYTSYAQFSSDIASGAIKSHFFNTAGSYGAGSSLVQTPVQAGYATTPVLSYSSYARFSSDVKSGAIKYPYKWVMYDPEDWSKTPVGEQQNPILYMELFGKLARAHGLKVVEAPALDLCSVSGTQLPRKSGETCSQWFARVNIAGGAAADGNLFVLQDESNTTNVSVYDSLYSTPAAQARAANSAVSVYSEVSTANGTATQMIAAAKSISPDGMHVAAPGATATADQFFKSMKAAGY